MMKYHLRNLAVAALLAIPFAVQAQSEQDSSPDVMLENYGWFLAQNVNALDLNAEEQEAFIKGVKSALAGDEGPEDKQAMAQQVQAYLQERVTKIQEKKSASFFEDLAKNPDVKKSPTGLYYEIIEEGEEGRASADDSVKVHYAGSLVDGTEFDSSYKRGEPATFPVGGVVKGFGEGVQLVGKGGKVKLYIPGNLGYGPTPPPGSGIPPNGTLIFEVEMIEINPES